ncbi:MAG: hypothetical protein KIT36_20660 [Alphaproteobacteria bacterium]|nr:hypothetical protein [Alphaproteobacteria bacterium]
MRAAMFAAAIGLALASPAAAESFDGTYAGTISCESIVGVSQRPLRGSFKMTINAAAARYEREIQTGQGQPTGVFERGSGSVTPAGVVTLTGAAQIGGSNATANYNGTITGGVARLTGIQKWTKSGDRKCSIEARVAR